MFELSPRTSYLPGASVVLSDSPHYPIMTVLRTGIWGNQAWYVVAWLDTGNHRHEAFLSETELLPAARSPQPGD